MSFNIRTLLRQVDSLCETLEDVSKYSLELNTNLTITVRVGYRAHRTIHLVDLKKLFKVYIHHFDEELLSIMRFNILDENKFCHLKNWSHISHLKDEIIGIYRLIYNEYPEKLI